MARVDPADAGLVSGSSPRRRAERRRATSGRSTSRGSAVGGAERGFLAQFDRLVVRKGGPRSVDGGLDELLDALHHTGDLLKRTPTLRQILDYKEAVAEFVAYALDNMLEVAHHESPGALQKRKRYVLVEVVDEKLERLARDVLSRQADQLALAARVDEITGLLVDMAS